MNIPNPPTSDLDRNEAVTGRSSSGRRRGLLIGGSAGLIGGGLVGLALTLPSLTSAASETTTPTPVVVDVQVPGETSDAGAFDPTGRIREVLQDLVDDGTISAEQADAVAGHLAANAPQHRGPGGHGGRGDHGGHGGRGEHGRPGFDGEVVAGLLGIDAEELRSELMAGRSLAEVAEANGVDAQTVIDALVAEAQAHLDMAVEAGRLTEDEAAAKITEMTERITARVNGEAPLGR